jgi:hypothetical protein
METTRNSFPYVHRAMSVKKDWSGHGSMSASPWITPVLCDWRLRDFHRVSTAPWPAKKSTSQAWSMQRCAKSIAIESSAYSKVSISVAWQGLSSRGSWLLANRRWTGGRRLSLVKRCDQVADKGSR